MTIKILLIVGITLAAVPLLRGVGARHLAIRRLLLILFVAFAVASVLVPSLWSRMANAVGVGRGTDLVLYALVVAFLGFVMTSYLRFRRMEAQLTKLARQFALLDIGPYRPLPPGLGSTEPEVIESEVGDPAVPTSAPSQVGHVER